DRGYSFSYLPGLCIAAGAGLRLVARDGARLLRTPRSHLVALTPRLRVLGTTPSGTHASTNGLPTRHASEAALPRSTVFARVRRPRARALYVVVLALLVAGNLQSFLLGRSRLSAYEVD